MTDNQFTEISKKLNQIDQDIVLKTVKEIRKNGDVRFLPVLAELLMNSQSKEVKTSVQNIFNDLKAPEGKPQMLEILKAARFVPILSKLVSACWNSGLDFTEDLEFFIDMAIQHDYLIAIEAYTVIENMPGTVDESKLADMNQKVKRAAATTDDTKRDLLSEIAFSLDNFNGNTGDYI